MIKCPKCNKELKDEAKFCYNCGAQIFETIFCTKCGNKTSTEFNNCPSCGAPLTPAPFAAQSSTTSETESVVENQPIETPKAENVVKDQNASLPETVSPVQTASAAMAKKPFPLKAVVFGAIGIVVVAIIAIIIVLISEKTKNNIDYAFYFKDNEILYTDFIESHQLTTRFNNEISNDEMPYVISSSEVVPYVSENGKYVFYPDKVDTSDQGKNLYFKEIAKLDSEAVKVDSGVVCYTVNAAATVVTYMKYDGDPHSATLYQYKIDDDSKEKIASEVNYFKVSDDGKTIIYMNTENSLYFKKSDQDKEKMSSDISSLKYINEEFNTVYYIKEDSLYKQVIGEDKEKIVSDIFNIIEIYDSGEIYYIKNDLKNISYMDYVDDDMKEIDATITQPDFPDYPDAPDYPSYSDYDDLDEYDVAFEKYRKDYEEYQAECEALDDAYYDALDVYQAKVARDELRSSLEAKTIEQICCSLYFYNGVEEINIADSLIHDDFDGYGITANDVPVIAYAAQKQTNIVKTKLSDITSIDDIDDKVQENLHSSFDTYIAVKDTATVIDSEKAPGFFQINDSGTVVYYIDDIDSSYEYYGTLYRIDIIDGVVGKPEMYSEDVYALYSYFVNNNDFLYFKDIKGRDGELYINKSRIDYDVNIYRCIAEGDNKNYKLFYFVDYIDDNGTLKVYDGENSTKISDDVYHYVTVPDGRILYLYDYSENYNNGELYEWSGEETKK